MVKPYEEEQENILDEKKFNVLFVIFSRYVQDTYKQFKWEIDMYDRRGTLQTAITPSTEIEISLNNYKKLFECDFFYYIYRYDKEYRYDKGEGFDQKQTFPVNRDMKPKELGKLAQNVFKWVKEQMKKIPD